MNWSKDTASLSLGGLGINEFRKIIKGLMSKGWLIFDFRDVDCGS